MYVRITTGADGGYVSPRLYATTRPINVAASASGYVAATLFGVDAHPGATSTAEPIPLVPSASGQGAITGTLRNARNNEVIRGLTVRLFNGLGSAGAFVTAASDANGLFSFTGLTPGTYTIDCPESANFAANSRTGIAVGNGSVSANQDLILSPLANDIRIVLTWGEQPSDLDSHLTGPNPSPDPSRFHVYYSSVGNFTSPPFAGLDLDDTSALGPETITITQLSGGIYRYSVHDYSNRTSNSSTALGRSSARVDLYCARCAEHHTTFFVPSGPGTLWTVFELQGTIANPSMTARNDMGFASDPASILKPQSKVSGGTDANLIARTARHSKLRRR